MSTDPKIEVDLSLYQNKDFEIGAPRWKQLAWYFTSLIVFQSGLCPVSNFMVYVLRTFGAKMGKGIVLKPHVKIKYPWKLTIGNHVWIGEHVWIDNLATVDIHDHVCISQGALLLTGNHRFDQIDFALNVQPIVLERGSWIGSKSVVCPGVLVSSHAVLSVGSVATSGILESFQIYQGNPAQKRKERIILRK